jgi:hypothetical protein
MNNKISNMKSSIFDKNGIEVSKGDILAFPYITPVGDMTEGEGFREQVQFKYGCFGIETKTRYIPLMEWMITKQGEYVSNYGNKVVYTEKYPFWVVKQKQENSAEYNDFDTKDDLSAAGYDGDW